MCHGAWCWDQGFMQVFTEAGYNCFAMDLPGHEAPGKNIGINQKSIEDYVQAVHEAIEEIGDACILIGHSMGGFVTQKYLEIHQGCQAVILISPVPYFGILKGALRYVGKHPSAAINLLLRDIYGPFVKNAQELYHSTTDIKEIERYKGLMCAESFKVLIEMMFKPVKKPRSPEVPMLCIGAKEDQVIRLDEVRQTASFHAAQLSIAEAFGHNMMLDKGFEHIAQDMIGWLSSLRV